MSLKPLDFPTGIRPSQHEITVFHHSRSPLVVVHAGHLKIRKPRVILRPATQRGGRFSLLRAKEKSRIKESRKAFGPTRQRPGTWFLGAFNNSCRGGFQTRPKPNDQAKYRPPSREATVSGRVGNPPRQQTINYQTGFASPANFRADQHRDHRGAQRRHREAPQNRQNPEPAQPPNKPDGSKRNSSLCIPL